MRVLTNAEFSQGMSEEEGKGKSLTGSQMSKEENGSKMLPRRLSKKLGINAMVN